MQVLLFIKYLNEYRKFCIFTSNFVGTRNPL